MSKPEKLFTIHIPEKLVKDLDYFGQRENKNRNQMVKEAMHFFISEKNKSLLHEKMKNGYQEMGNINLALAEIGLCIEFSLLEDYEVEMLEWKEVR